ncbi:MAG: hydrolase [Spirochaetae bacterium HGW-Spirochaetae-1]|jgi:hypothetical protein|nr:MAG: hydrolase [Spirochaetae bacterium HGW-Spirochaetae-1]
MAGRKDLFKNILTEEEKARPYASLYGKAMSPVSPDILDIIETGPMDPRNTLPFENINDLLNPGYHAVETGYCRMPDNSCYVSVLTKMPGLTGKMIDWWFAWHPLESLRYKMWYPGAHFGNSVQDIARASDTRLSLRERYYHNTNYAVEDIGIGPDIMAITFFPPEEYGFDTSRFEKADVATVICALCGSATKKVTHTNMIHFVRSTKDGVEMRSRFWIGRKLKLDFLSGNSIINKLADTKPVRGLAIPKQTPHLMARHCAFEYSNLAAILPGLYREYGKA